MPIKNTAKGKASRVRRRAAPSNKQRPSQRATTPSGSWQYPEMETVPLNETPSDQSEQTDLAKPSEYAASIASAPAATESDLESTRKFWNEHPCDGDFDTNEQRLQYRFIKDYYIPSIIEDHIPPGGEVLEIGCGQGADMSLLAKKADRVTGVDLTPEGVARAAKFLDEVGAKNAVVLVANAEKLPFRDAMFDSVYSFGVMHHTDGTQACIDEAYRVLKPEGTAVIMLYRFWSPQFLVSKTLRGITYPLRKALAAFFSTKMFRNSRFWGTAPSELFGVPYFKAYSEREIRKMFHSFTSVSVERYNTGFARLRLLTPESPRMLKLLDKLENMTRDKLGFFNVIIAKK
ncbi:MAG: class I SAM-dependent methyltransferase [Nanoarchaeota archaeon]